MKLRNLIIILTTVCFARPIYAQDIKQDSMTLKKELTLEKEYTPTIRDASKIGILPELKEPEAPKTRVELAQFSVPYEVKPQLTTLPAGSFFTGLPYSKKKGYLKVGVSSFVDFDGDLGYQILNTEKDRLNIFGSGRISNGNVTYLQDDEKGKMKINDYLGGLDFLHDFGGMNLNANVKYTYSAYNYYGYKIPDYSFDLNQVNDIFEIGAGFTDSRPDELNYSLRLSNVIFKQKYLHPENLDGGKENRFSFDWDIRKGFNADMKIGFGGYWKNYKSTVPENVIIPDAFDCNNLSLNPYFEMEGDNWALRLGVKVNLLFMPGDDKNNISPDVKINFRPSEKISLYLAAEGGVQDNGFYSMFYENRYVSPEIRVRDSRSPFDGKIGVQGAPSGNLWFDLFAGYKVVKDEHFFISKGMIYPVYMDADVLRLGGTLKYNYDALDLGLKMAYYNWNVSPEVIPEDHPDPNHRAIESEPWGKPDFETELTAGYKISRLPLRLDAFYRLEAGRKALVSTGSESMKNVNNLGVSGTYTVNDTFSLFAKVNNLLFQKYDLFYGYPAQNFSIMGGVSILF